MEEEEDLISSPELFASEFEQSSPPVSKNTKTRERPDASPERKKIASPPAAPRIAIPPPVASTTEVGFLIRLILYGALIFGGLFFYGTLTVALHNQVSLPRAAMHLMAWRMLPPVERTPLQIKGTVYPLHQVPQDTSSVPLDLSAHHARPLVSSLESSFVHYLLSNSMYPCLCMHHMRVPSEKRYSLCAASNRDQLYMMANLDIIGGSNETALLRETSVACDAPYNRRRHLSVFVSWECPRTNQRLYSRFEGATAMCLQIAYDELRGGARHCENET
jgi:hypothetical protein